jgi:hypothetical protein
MTTRVVSDSEMREIGSVLSRHNIALAVAVGAAGIDNPTRTPGECGFGVEGMVRPGINAMIFQRLKRLGLDIKYVAMDEPLTFGHYYTHNNACQYSIEDTARRVSAAVAEIKASYPDVRVVDEEAPTITSAAQWKDDFRRWLEAYHRATGSQLDAVVLDVDGGAHGLIGLPQRLRRPTLVGFAQEYSLMAQGLALRTWTLSRPISETYSQWMHQDCPLTLLSSPIGCRIRPVTCQSPRQLP